jgi:phosphate/sulfate permease
MVADGADLQASTFGNIVLAWLPTLPAAMLAAGQLYALFLPIVRTAGIA